MKIISAVLSLLLVAKASSKEYAAEKPIEVDLDNFDEQVEAARIKHHSTEIDEDGSRPVISTEEEDALIAVVGKENRPGKNKGREDKNTPKRAREWLKAHNDERIKWQEKEWGGQARLMKRSADLEKEAESWAKKLVKTCKNRGPSKSEYGWNSAMKHGQSNFRSVKEVFKLWNNKLYKGYPNNKEMSQVLWKATEYVGCADANSAPGASEACTVSVCFYAKRGNCGLKRMRKWSDHVKKMTEEAGCGPCPPDYPKCTECNNKRTRNGRVLNPC